MSLYSRIRAGEGAAKIPVHPFSAALGEWAEGQITRQNVIDAFALSAGEQTEIDALAATYASKPSAAAKVGYLWQLERAFILVEAGLYDEAKAKSVLGF
jgi:hypothetical protein